MGRPMARRNQFRTQCDCSLMFSNHAGEHSLLCHPTVSPVIALADLNLVSSCVIVNNEESWRHHGRTQEDLNADGEAWHLGFCGQAEGIQSLKGSNLHFSTCDYLIIVWDKLRVTEGVLRIFAVPLIGYAASMIHNDIQYKYMKLFI